MSALAEFAARLAQERREKQARDHRDISQKDVAEAIGETPTNYSRWEAGLNMPGEAKLAKLAAYYGVTSAWLRYGVETKSGAPRMEEHQQVSPGSLLTGRPSRVSRGKKP